MRGLAACPAQRAGGAIGTSPQSRRRLDAFRHRLHALPSRRDVASLLGAGVAACVPALAWPESAHATRESSMEALKGKDYGKERMRFADFTETPSGLQYYDFREGTGRQPRRGDTCVVDWTGVTIGYYGRPFEAKNKTKGSSFNDDDKDYYRFRLGEDRVIAGFQEAVEGMKEGGIRRVIVPWELSYPDGDFRTWGPKPTTFSGERALSFVVEGKNNMIDKTLQFDIKLVRVDP